MPQQLRNLLVRFPFLARFRRTGQRSVSHLTAAELAKSGIPRIIMVSCNPASWSRDAKTLKDAGYKLESLDVIDQFVYSPHLEIVAVFQR
mgnify:CR=1 FL=1